jgi:hypothetical protein
LFGTALLVILNPSPGWQAIPFLTSDTTQVLWLVNLLPGGKHRGQPRVPGL